MKVSELEGAELDYWVAKAQEWDLVDNQTVGYFIWNTPDNDWIDQEIYTPTTNWAQCGALLEEFSVDVYIHEDEGDMEWWGAQAQSKLAVYSCPDPRIAICRAVVASVFGEEVSDD